MSTPQTGRARPELPPRVPGTAAELVFQYRTRPLEFLERVSREVGDVVRFPYQLTPQVSDAIYVFHPDHARHIFLDNWRNYPKPDDYGGFVRIMGQGLVTSNDSFWLRQRRLIQPAFHHERIAGYVELMSDNAERMAEQWIEYLDGPINAYEEMYKISLSIITQSIFGTRDALNQKAFAQSWIPLGRELVAAVPAYQGPLLSLPVIRQLHRLYRGRVLMRHIESLKRLVVAAIDEKRRVPGEDVVSMLLAARYEDGEPMSSSQLLDEVMTLLLAGHDTTASALTWVLYVLGRNPESMARVVEEVDEVVLDGPVRFEHISRLTYTKCVIQETMRLYPPIWTVGRVAREEDDIGGCTIPAGSLVRASQYVIHRRPDIWLNPTEFDPDRFAPEKLTEIPRFAYLPFLQGPRKCIGDVFSILEAQVVLATLVRRTSLRVLSGATEPLPLVSLRPRDPVLLEAQKRS